MNVPLLSVFFFFLILFSFFFKTTSPHRKWPFIVIVQLQIWGAALNTKFTHLKVREDMKMMTISVELMKSFNPDSKKWKSGSVLLKDESIWCLFVT